MAARGNGRFPTHTFKTFCGFSMGSNLYCAGRVDDLCVLSYDGAPEGSSKSGFMEKPGIEHGSSNTCKLFDLSCVE